MDALEKLLANLDVEDVKLRESDIYQLLDNYKKTNPSDDSIALCSEIIAFAFFEHFDLTNWQLFYKPFMSWNMPDGTKQSFPSPTHINSEMIDYWYQRAMTAIHPILKMRYAGLVWAFYKDIKKSKSPFEMSHIVIDSIAIIADKSLHKHEQPIITKLKYGLYLALSISDDDRIKKITNSILNYEKNAIKGDTVADAWSTSFDHLLQNKKIDLTNEQKNEIINRIEFRLDNLVKAMPAAGGIFPVREAAIRLAKYYQGSSLVDKMKTALLKYVNTTLQLTDSVSPIISQKWLSEALGTAKDFKLRDEEKQISIKLIEVNRNMDEHLHTTTITTQISDNEMQKFLDAMVEGSLNDCLNRFLINSLVCKKTLRQQVFDLAKANPISYSIPRSITDHKGRQVASIGALDDDLDGHLIWQLHINTQLVSAFKRMAISKIFSKHQPTVEILTNYILRSPFFDAEKRTLIEIGLDAYIKNQPVIAIHVLIPQIEDAIRNILFMQNHAVFKNNRSGGINLKTLDELLREDAVVNLLGVDTAFNLRVLLTDPRGLNLRNDVCHGTINPANLSMNTADIVFLMLLILSELQLV